MKNSTCWAKSSKVRDGLDAADDGGEPFVAQTQWIAAAQDDLVDRIIVGKLFKQNVQIAVA